MEYGHYSVMLKECIDGLCIKPDGTYVDATLGMGGHSYEIARRLKTGRLVSIDRDVKAMERAVMRLEPLMERITLVHGNFRDMNAILDDLGIGRVDGMLFDLGVSSPQLDETDRGFSYMSDAPLDMRMDQNDRITAADIVNTWKYENLKRILYDFGEERYAPRIAEAIVRYRENKRIETTFQLVDIVKGAMPGSALREAQHPAKRTFQAVRIAVNEELEAVSEVLGTAADRLKTGGRLAVISFHSLEDRIVKNAIASRENGCTCPRDFPVCVCGFTQTLHSVTKKPMLPSQAEIEENPRSRSAKLRIAERV
ncbi:MAG: 16S rRNA (cytosine(1402)-N(4))-methyltransferase RsmH [Oscillospiraceae bacterium]|nr:16S rRNA (cytosine(1402)-N(4))-methyltransferase RsmH [Oscillospiraceae bacterium]